MIANNRRCHLRVLSLIRLRNKNSKSLKQELYKYQMVLLRQLRRVNKKRLGLKLFKNRHEQYWTQYLLQILMTSKHKLCKSNFSSWMLIFKNLGIVFQNIRKIWITAKVNKELTVPSEDHNLFLSLMDQKQNRLDSVCSIYFW